MILPYYFNNTHFFDMCNVLLVQNITWEHDTFDGSMIYSCPSFLPLTKGSAHLRTGFHLTRSEMHCRNLLQKPVFALDGGLRLSPFATASMCAYHFAFF